MILSELLDFKVDKVVSEVEGEFDFVKQLIGSFVDSVKEMVSDVFDDLKQLFVSMVDKKWVGEIKSLVEDIVSKVCDIWVDQGSRYICVVYFVFNFLLLFLIDVRK